MIRFDRSICRDLEQAGRREWLETNGLGGFASSTITGCNTRRYHGLLVAATKPPVGRMVLLAKLEETVILDGRRVELSVNRYPGVVHPEGQRYLREFRLDPFPVFTYDIDGIELRKAVFVVHGANTVIIEYEIQPPRAGRECRLEVRPLVAFRDYHGLTHENSALDPALEVSPGRIRMAPYRGVPPLYFEHTAAAPAQTGCWYRNFEYDRERERGLDYREDLFQPFVLCFDLARDPKAAIVASTEPRRVDVEEARAAEIERRAEVAARACAGAAAGGGADGVEGVAAGGGAGGGEGVDACGRAGGGEGVAAGARAGGGEGVDAGGGEGVPAGAVAGGREDIPAGARGTAAVADPFARRLAAAADQFVVRRDDGFTAIAGYPWFTDWGRDTMISLPGLALATGRDDVARAILLAFAAHVDRGMVPNRFPDAGQAPEYNTADATLWFCEAVRALAEQTGDYDFVQEHLFDVLAGIIDWHERGTRYGIHADSDGLLYAGSEGVQLTWMDTASTPRTGKPVEIQALWYNALRVMEDLATRFSRDPRRYGELADRARSSFAAQFWNETDGCLYDVVNGDARDASIRPNQIFAVSLPHRMLSPAQERSVVEVVRRHLLTPYGLRTLSPADPQYRGRYAGDMRSRDAAYHQGTVWPWLLGPFVTAWHNSGGEPRDWLGELRRSIQDEGVGQIPEVFDGDAPHRPGGCIAQAWSVAELLRITLRWF